jgi:hypothetical protein
MNALTPSRNLTIHARIWELVLEGLKLFAIALGCIVVLSLAFIVWVKTGLIKVYIPARWFGLFYWTCFLVWFVCRQLRRDLGRGMFWVVLLALLTAHVGAFIVVLRSFPDWPAAWFMFAFIIEAPLMVMTIESVVDSHHHR